jgi:tetratricopeptide (TPR) repeat protein
VGAFTGEDRAAGVIAALVLALAVASADGGPVVVVPPDGPGGAPMGWIGALVAETLPRALQRVGVPAVPDADRRRAQEALGVPSASTTRATSIRVAEALGASRLVVGAWEQRGPDVTLSLRLLDAARGSLSAPLVGSAPIVGLGGLVHSLAWDVALAGPRAPTGTREALQQAAAAVSPNARRALGEGLIGRDAAARVAGARRALVFDPSYEEAALVLARLLVDTSAFEEARTVLARMPSSSVFRREARFLDGVALLGLGRYREADVLYAELSRTRAAAALSNRAVARMRLGPGAKGASALLRQAVEAEPAASDLPLNLGWALLVEGDAQAASFWLKGAVRRDPGDAHGRLLLTWALAASGRAAEAEEQWKAAVALAPTYQGMRNADLSRKLERILVSEQALILDPERRADSEESRAHAIRGAALLEAKDVQGAVAELARAALLDPYAAGPHRFLARARRAQGDEEKAVEELRTALFCREDPVLRRELVELLRALGRIEEAKRVQE